VKSGGKAGRSDSRKTEKKKASSGRDGQRAWGGAGNGNTSKSGFVYGGHNTRWAGVRSAIKA